MADLLAHFAFPNQQTAICWRIFGPNILTAISIMMVFADGNLRHLFPINHFTATAKTHIITSVFAVLERPRQGSNLRQPA